MVIESLNMDSNEKLLSKVSDTISIYLETLTDAYQTVLECKSSIVDKYDLNSSSTLLDIHDALIAILNVDNKLVELEENFSQLQDRFSEDIEDLVETIEGDLGI